VRATLAAATRVNVAALEQREPENVALDRYAELGRLLAGSGGAAAALPDGEARASLVQLLEDWRARLAVPRLSATASRRPTSQPSSPTRAAAA